MASMTKRRRKGPVDRANFIEGRVEILAYKKGVLFHREVQKNILLYQGLAEVIRTLFFTSPLAPRVITRMAIGDQGTIPSDSTVPKVPVKNATGLYHEVYREDFDSTTPTLFSPTGVTIVGNTHNGSQTIDGLVTTVGITIGEVVTGTGIQIGSVVDEILTPNSVHITLPATSDNTGIDITFAGTVNECECVATFNATDVAITAFSNPSQPVINEVGLVIINPAAAGGLVRAPVTSPNAPLADEILLSVRTFNSVPFVAANDISVTIRYTIFTE